MASNWLERHPRISIVAGLVVAFLILDMLFANGYKLINGHPWADEAGLKVERIASTYRTLVKPFHHDLIKNVSVDDARYGHITYRIRTNSLGFKDRIVRDVPCVSGKYRLLFIGDSFTEGIAVEYPQTFVGLIDSALAPEGIEVLNAGVAGYSPIIYWRKIKYLIEDVGLRFDELAVFLDISDPQDEVRKFCLDDNENVRYVDNSGSTSGSGSELNGIGVWVRKNTIATFLALRIVRDLYDQVCVRKPAVVDHDESRWTTDSASFRAYGREGLARMEIYMDRLVDLLKEHDIKLMVAVYPWPSQIYYGDLNSIQVSYWEDWCRKHGVRFLNCFPYFFNRNNGGGRIKEIGKYYIKGDYHFNANGHRLIADAFLDFYDKK